MESHPTARRDGSTSLSSAHRRLGSGLPPARKSLGQHFLTDRNILRRIAEAADIAPSDTVVEIGAGPGDLTAELAARAGKVVAIEIDAGLAAGLRERFAGAANVMVVEGDALDVDYAALVAPARKWLVVGNLPYNVGAAIVRRLLELPSPPLRLVVMLQREVADSMLALPGEMTLLSLAVQVYARGRKAFDVAPGAFHPPPKVRSSVLRLDTRAMPLVPVSEAARFFEVARAGFSGPRKQVHNSLARGLGLAPQEVRAALDRAGVGPALRPGALSIDDWLRLKRSLDAAQA